MDDDCLVQRQQEAHPVPPQAPMAEGQPSPSSQPQIRLIQQGDGEEILSIPVPDVRTTARSEWQGQVPQQPQMHYTPSPQQYYQQQQQQHDQPRWQQQQKQQQYSHHVVNVDGRTLPAAQSAARWEAVGHVVDTSVPLQTRASSSARGPTYRGRLSQLKKVRSVERALKSLTGGLLSAENEPLMHGSPASLAGPPPSSSSAGMAPSYGGGIVNPGVIGGEQERQS